MYLRIILFVDLDLPTVQLCSSRRRLHKIDFAAEIWFHLERHLDRKMATPGYTGAGTNGRPIVFFE
jgi:hypothetical protein